MVSPTLTCSNRVAVAGTSRVTTLPCCPRIVTVRPAWSTASTVPWTVTWLSASRVWAVEMAGADISTPTHITHARSCFATAIHPWGRRNAGDTGAPRAGCRESVAGTSGAVPRGRSHACEGSTCLAATVPSSTALYSQLLAYGDEVVMAIRAAPKSRAAPTTFRSRVVAKRTDDVTRGAAALRASGIRSANSSMRD